jgi:CRP/FNR family cyclic AMP-dependent transcriptional regulator
MVLAYLNKGQFFGEMGLFYEQPTRSAWVRTRQQCELAEMTYPRFRQLAAESPGLVFELATQLATRLDRTNRKLGDLAFVDVTGRVAHAIMDLCSEPDAMTHPEGMQIKVSRQELSRLVGCSREMAGRVLKVLEDQGLLRATGKTIVVFNARPKMKTRPVVVPVQCSRTGCVNSALPLSVTTCRSVPRLPARFGVQVTTTWRGVLAGSAAVSWQCGPPLHGVDIV